ncbi:MAG: hypothetical protein ACSLE8_15555 [Rhodococcus sp. (in: high G+C Gram-positive bacteria)]
MGKHTPKMTDPELVKYLDEHLGSELKWLLRAATEWHVQKTLHLKIDGYNVQVYAMDSSFLRARTLFEFLTQKTTGNYYGADAFGVPLLVSPLYKDEWRGALHGAVMHAQDRSKPGVVKSFDPSDPLKKLKEMPVDFGREIVRLWRDFAAALGAHTDPRIRALKANAETILNDAISGAAQVVGNSMVAGHKTPPVSW